MEYREALEYIDTIQARLGSDYSLAEVIELARRFGRPDRKIKVIHIAGTNGKGSVGNDICYILAEAGYTVGRYISPTIFDYRERIQKVVKSPDETRCEYISKEDTAAILTKIQSECEAMLQEGFGCPTAFEIETVMAFLMFCQWNVDVAVVETGLGGRADATNIIENPLLCVFTSISMDHMQILGDSLHKIAREKYGIIQEGTRVVSKKQKECQGLLEQCCLQKNAKLSYMQEEQLAIHRTEIERTSFSYRGVEYEMRQAGTYQIENAAIAIEAVLQLETLGFSDITQEHIKAGLLHSRWKGRFDVVSKEPFVLADGAHNEDAAKKLSMSLQRYFPGEAFRFVIGVFQDKEYEKVIQCLLPLAKEVYTVTAPGKRGLLSNKLGNSVREILQMQSGFRKTALLARDIYECESMQEAFDRILLENLSEKVVVCGSLSILGEVYQYFEGKEQSE